MVFWLQDPRSGKTDVWNVKKSDVGARSRGRGRAGQGRGEGRGGEGEEWKGLQTNADESMSVWERNWEKCDGRLSNQFFYSFTPVNSNQYRLLNLLAFLWVWFMNFSLRDCEVIRRLTELSDLPNGGRRAWGVTLHNTWCVSTAGSSKPDQHLVEIWYPVLG